MSIGQPSDEICYQCGALVPYQKLPEHDGIPGQLVCGEEQYQSGMLEHWDSCPGKPLDQESRVRLEKIEEQLSHWSPFEIIEGCVKSKESFRRLILVRVPRSVHIELLEKAKGMGISLEQYCVDVLSRPLRDLTTA